MTIQGTGRCVVPKICYESLNAMAVPEFYSGKVLYPAIAVLIALSALFGLYSNRPGVNLLFLVP